MTVSTNSKCVGKLLALVIVGFITTDAAVAHEDTAAAHAKRRRADRLRLLAQASKDDAARIQGGNCHLRIQLIDADSQQPIAGNVRLTSGGGAEALALSELIQRPEGWFSIPADGAVVSVPQAKLALEAFRGLETVLAKREVDLTGKETARLQLPLQRFYRAADKRLISGNTHLHLMRISRQEADHYLRVVPKADDLDLLYVSHLRRAVDDETYITNQYSAVDLAELSDAELTLRHGQEHRHNFEAYGEGYGHVMFLDITKLIEPVSLGPGITHTGTDGTPLRRGIDMAHGDGATVIWCHNTFGLEDIPSWMSRRLHAHNIFDGGDHGSYKDSYYRFLNIGLKVPFSTGTDWFIYDLSRVYVPLEGEPSSSDWLNQLAAGRSFITNGPFLELRAEDHQIGDTVDLEKARIIEVEGRAVGRGDFHGLELIHNGQVVHRESSRGQDGHFDAVIKFPLQVDGPGWIAMRVPLETQKNEFGRALFAHTSPIYLDLRGRRIFQTDVAEELLIEMDRGISLINNKGLFGSEEERESVLSVHRQGIEKLTERIKRYSR